MPDENSDERRSVALIEALSRVWMRIRLYHPDVPPVVLLAAPAHRDRLNVLGHFSALRWKGKKKADEHLHEVVVIAEHLDRPAEDVVETLIHEAAHALNFERGIHDCSASQYHNAHFKAAAEELGLEVSQVRHYGYALTALPEATARRYETEIDGLKAVMIHRKKPVSVPKGPGPGPPKGGDNQDDDEDADDGKPRSRLRKATCACQPPFIIRVAKKTIATTVIRCESCGEPFRLA
jgi:hypothetical protein